jgi:nucleoside 2-deoxyribosyltransferase
VRLLEDWGHEVLTRHLVEDNAWEADRQISPQDVYRRDMAWLEQCDLFIAEVSGSSFGLGFETGYLLGATNKRVILLFSPEIATKSVAADHRKLARELHIVTLCHCGGR